MIPDVGDGIGWVREGGKAEKCGRADVSKTAHGSLRVSLRGAPPPWSSAVWQGAREWSESIPLRQ